jgi:hypothetical protein
MNPKTSQDLFNKIRSQFSNIKIGDENGGATADASEAVFFEFEWQPDSDTFGSVSISIADGENMKVYYNRDLVEKIDESEKDEWYAFLKELKDFAVEHSLTFDVRDITKSNLTKQDYQNLADTNQTVNTDDMSEELNRITKLAGVEVKEGLTGTAKRSYENLDKTRLIIRHSGKVDEEIPGSRSRHIESLYIENEDGERFKYPLTHLAGARAMTRHVANGGRPHDEFGEHIIQTSEDIAKLNSFSRYVSHKDQLNDNAGDIIEQTKLKLENLREYMRNLSKQSHYENASKDFKTADEQILDDETVNKLREKFTLKNLDNRVEDALPLINKIMSELEAPKEESAVSLGDYGSQIELMFKQQNKYKSMDDFEASPEWKQFVASNPMLRGESQVQELDPGDEPIDAPVEPAVDHGAVVQSFLTDPESKIMLNKKVPSHVTKYKGAEESKNSGLLNILSDIASRMLTKTGAEDRVANFASRVADAVSQEGEPFFKPDVDHNKNKKIAIQLAQRYLKDRQEIDPADYNPKKDIKGKAHSPTEAFENWVNGIDEYAREPKDEKDREEKLKALQNIQLDPNTSKDPETVRALIQRKKELMKKEPAFAGEQVTFEDIKPYVSMYKDDQTGKTVYDVLDKDGASAFKTNDSKVAMAYLSKNFNKLKMDKDERIDQSIAQQKADAETNPNWGKDVGPVESINESRSKIVAAIKAKADENAQNIAGVEAEIERITQLANYH